MLLTASATIRLDSAIARCAPDSANRYPAVRPLRMRSFLLFVALLGRALVARRGADVSGMVAGRACFSRAGSSGHEPRGDALRAVRARVPHASTRAVADRASLGYGLPRREFMRQLAIGWVGGLALMAPLARCCSAWTCAQVIPDLDVNLLGAGRRRHRLGFRRCAIEETFFRGVLLTAVARTSSAAPQ